MSYFDDLEEYRYKPLIFSYRRPHHYTEESFVENVDGRFAMRKTVCGLEFSQSSGRVTPKAKKVTCKECLKKIHTDLKESTANV
jgi:hypothetical protein